ncbi:ATP-dependent DNA helicase RecG [Deinococcus cellulosilyticus]|uniref:ATP-dependent DNA helicase RecG n=1 Tax=Deinococcus cellulosilyticus (strain DSM 18568 / NBRC 106333 / KACC 11606 / 5516J-15) TaxID=1223518 RepID=A0A511N683_DEIC1|nr:ATP-dependent DNA helicase RecG [Deinococcus cellulosilyticus]GEM47911.1 ATP-dependent DNA helicase RecG [Deinococcus cellulosilyticus NBRC 106333 = KACC 11606]
MATLQELQEKLRKPLERELLMGCQNRVVAGGLEKLLDNLGKPFPKVREVLRQYESLSVEEREQKLRLALELLTAPQKSETPPSRPTMKVSKEPEIVTPKNWQEDTLVEKIALSTQAVKKLHALGLRNLRDVLHNYPRKHEDRRALPNLYDIEDGQKITVAGVITGKNRRTPKPGMLILEAVVQNAYGHKVKCTWFQQPWIERSLKVGAHIIVTGRAKKFGRQIQLNVEYMEEDSESSLSTGRIVGVYDIKEGISQDFVRKTVHDVLTHTPVTDYLPGRILQEHGLINLPDALNGIHFPRDEVHLAKATDRLRFDEYLFLELRILLQGGENSLLGKRFSAKREDIDTFESSLPFRFTNAQRRVMQELASDMKSEKQMARLVQGDVGSGKTAVAACALYLATRDLYQGALMAPTEILAKQHYANLTRYLFPLGVRCCLLIGAMTAKEKRENLQRIATGEVDVVVGTQALIQEAVQFNNLGLAVIDEEHRFGVQQRRALLKDRPDVIVMSATPIPRSLALTLYGDLELSIIDELPPGRTPISTKLLHDSSRLQAYSFVMQQIREGRQAYAVTSLIEESETLTELLAATQLADNLKEILPEARIDLLHGKMSAQEKEEIMDRFRRHEFDLLVSTTVIEVGVDVPNSTVMVIENAERFGLAQLHQLRGRVGRGSNKSFCILVAGDASQKTRKRLKVIEDTTDGFKIAEADLKIRGPGELRGTRQSGIPDLQLGDLTSDADIIEQARNLAKRILAADPGLEKPQSQRLKLELRSRSAQVAIREVI